MIKRTKKQWQHIMQAHAEYTGTTKQFCAERKIPMQTFYSRRHAMGLSVSLQNKKSPCKKAMATTSPTPQTGQFVRAQVTTAPSSIVLQTKHVQLSLSTQCDPIWLATLLKGLAA
ncbi:hypothetical protein [Pseudoalteromonas sp.]|uniref:hypothetical protein n=1 Tax=Pseudoalteromonas sp. TaxID=53249 RepID=UPI00260E4A70|nr:hypothetical protein [Pseudoalteromonas sp.]